MCIKKIKIKTQNEFIYVLINFGVFKYFEVPTNGINYFFFASDSQQTHLKDH